MSERENNRFAPEGFLWVCCACGKTSRDQYGDPATSWDESCLLNSKLFATSRLVYANGRVIRVTEATPTPERTAKGARDE